MTISWDSLRPLNGSQNDAFEELCCQLASCEGVPAGSSFVRKGAPDAGIECYWSLQNGQEWGWQAKYFRSTPNDSQWGQMDESFKTALDKHPSLTKFIFCLPIDRADPRRPNQQWFMDKWNDHVEKWTGWAAQAGRVIEIEYWGESEIWNRLSLEQHRGRHFFWFNRELFSKEWFKSRVDEAIANLGERYTPELNVELPMAQLFDGLGRTPEFYNKVRSLARDIRKALAEVQRDKVRNVVGVELDTLGDHLKNLLSQIAGINEAECAPIDFDGITALASQASKRAWACDSKLQEVIERVEPAHTRDPKEDVRHEAYYLRRLAGDLRDLIEFFHTSEAKLANTPALLLAGDAGMGKSHLFGDVAKHRTAAGYPTLLLLGNHFNAGDPWSQIVEQLGLSCSREQLLGALDAAAQVSGGRALIFIDALNETDPRKMWLDRLPGMLSALTQFPRLGIAVSARSSYEATVVQDNLVPSRLIREVHHGFSGAEYQATQTFFAHFGIQPTVPLLMPEFDNPLFLKLFCQAIKNRGLTMMPSGVSGITAIFGFFLDSVNSKLHKPERLDFDEKDRVVQKAVYKLAELMAQNTDRWVARDVARDTINGVLPRLGHEKTLFRQLISEGVIAEDRFKIADGEWTEQIRFSYERFADHYIAKHLLDNHLSNHPGDDFGADKPLGQLVKDERTCRINQGLVEALSVQLPERISKELWELAPHAAGCMAIIEAFIESIVWRSPTAVLPHTQEYINKYALQSRYLAEKFWDAILMVSAIPAHPYNADRLHRNLLGLALADRDNCWSTFLHRQVGLEGSVDRLVEWALDSHDKSAVSDESVRLATTALSWFLTSPNRYLRDRATKGLVRLLTDRIQVLRKVLKAFKDVNDPYVAERLHAVVYGCAMRSNDSAGMADLARDIFQRIFDAGSPPPHILLRDYARGVIELALHRGVLTDLDKNKIRPPYRSDWVLEAPSSEDLKKYGEWQDDMPNSERARLRLYHSVIEHGDFARYTVESAVRNWSSHRLGEKEEPTAKEVVDQFVQSLTAAQRSSWESYCGALAEARLATIVESVKKGPSDSNAGGEGQEPSKRVEDAQADFIRRLGKRKLDTFLKRVLPCLENPNLDWQSNQFDAALAQRWIFNRVLELGWTAEKFGDFDWWVAYYENSRREHRAERIGKKYQWIALHEFLAHVSDCYKFKKGWSGGYTEYEGSWQVVGLRDIDPSISYQQMRPAHEGSHQNNWWFTGLYSSWRFDLDIRGWLEIENDLPAVKDLIKVTNSRDGSRWFSLEGFYKWEESTPPEEERLEVPRRELWYWLKAYLVKKSDLEGVADWAKRQNFMGRWMPEFSGTHKVFWGELFWSPSYKEHVRSNYENDGWVKDGKSTLPCKVFPASDQFHWESSGYDYSVEGNISCFIPTSWIVKNNSIRCDETLGHVFREHAGRIAFDPAMAEVGPSCLLVSEEAFLRYLKENDLAVFWILFGEKQRIGGWIRPAEYVGKLNISGAFRLQDGSVEGSVTTNRVQPSQ